MMFGDEWVERVLAEYLEHSVLVLNYQYHQLRFCSFVSLRGPCPTYLTHYVCQVTRGMRGSVCGVTP